MGDLIVMSRSKPMSGRAFSADHTAEIAFFTGVRYYRMDEPVEPAKPATTKPATTKLVGAKLAIVKRRRSPEQLISARRLRHERRHEALA